jgi:predicted site-specific integrase-resolvase
MKLSEWAERQGIHYMTAWRWWKAGKLPVPAYQTPSGSIIVELPKSQPGRAVIHARVSSHDQRADLDRQITHATGWATQEGRAQRSSLRSGLGSTASGPSCGGRWPTLAPPRSMIWSATWWRC